MTYEDYLERHIGGESIPEKDFPFYAEKAKAMLGEFTFGRSAESDLEEAAYAEVEIAQFLFENVGRRGIIGESNDGLSVSYGDGFDEVSGAYAIAKAWLGNTGLMYAGVEA